jgi:TP901 family phage tail tape measure protein
MPTEAASLFVTLSANTAPFSASMNAAEARLKAFKGTAVANAGGVAAASENGAGRTAKAWEGAAGRVESRWNKTANTMKSVGSNMTRTVSLPLGVVGGIAVKMAMDYEKSVNKIATLSSGSAKDVAMLRNQVLKLGGETARTPQQLADALYIIESGGQHGAAAMAILTKSAQASAVGLGETATIARGVTAAINAYAGTGLTAADATNTLAQAVKEGMVPADELVGVIGKLISVSGAMGVSFQSTMAAVAGLTRTGLDASVATNQLRQMLIGFQKPTEKVSSALQSVGLSAEQVRNSFQTMGIQDTLKMLWEYAGKGAKSVDEQRAKYVQFFQAISRGGAPALTLIGNNLKENDAIAQRMARSVDVVGASFERLRKQPGFQMQAGLQQIKNDLIILGEVILPMVAPVIVDVANAIQSALQWFKKLDPVLQKIIIGLTVFLVVLGPMMSLFGNLMTLGKGLAGIFMALGPALMNPYTLAFIAVAAAIAAAAYLIITNWSEIKAFFGNLWKDIQPTVQAGLDWLKGAWASVSGGVISAWQAVSGAVSSAVSWIAGAFTLVVTQIQPIINTVKAIVSGIGSTIATAFSSAFTAVGGFLSPIINVVRTMGGLFITVLGPAVHSIAGFFSSAFGVVSTVVTNAWNVIKQLANVIKSILLPVFSTLWNVVKSVFGGLASIVSGAFNVIKGVIKVFTGLFTLDFGKMWSGIKQIFSGALKAIEGVLTGAFNMFKSIGKGLIEALGGGISAAWGAIKTAVGAALHGVIGVINGIFGAFYNAGKFIFDGFRKGIEWVWNNVILPAIRGFINLLLAPINFILDKIGVGGIHPFGGGGSAGAAAAAGEAGYATGGMVNRPGYFAGEEAPRHPEYILATNPKYRQRNLGLWAQAGSALGVSGFAQGGVHGDAPHFDIGGIFGTLGDLAKAFISPGTFLVSKGVGAIANAVGGEAGAALRIFSGLGMPQLPDPISFQDFGLDKLSNFLIGKTLSWMPSAVGGLFGPGGMLEPVARALATAIHELGKPYITGGYGVDASGLDCSGYVSTILTNAGLASGHLITGDLKSWGEPGPGKIITVGVWGADSGPKGHTMIKIGNRYFESGGGGGGPHETSGWSMGFQWWRHPPGLAGGGLFDNSTIGSPGYQLTREQLRAGRMPGFATGGRYPNWTSVVATYFNDSLGYKGDNLYGGSLSYAELGMGTRLGGLPYKYPLDIQYGGKTVGAEKLDIGGGAPGAQIDLQRRLSDALGFTSTGKANVSIRDAFLTPGKEQKLTPGQRAAELANTARKAANQADAKEVKRYQAALKKLNERYNKLKYGRKIIKSLAKRIPIVPKGVGEVEADRNRFQDMWDAYAKTYSSSPPSEIVKYDPNATNAVTGGKGAWVIQVRTLQEQMADLQAAEAQMTPISNMLSTEETVTPVAIGQLAAQSGAFTKLIADTQARIAKTQTEIAAYVVAVRIYQMQIEAWTKIVNRIKWLRDQLSKKSITDSDREKWTAEFAGLTGKYPNPQKSLDNAKLDKRRAERERDIRKTALGKHITEGKPDLATMFGVLDTTTMRRTQFGNTMVALADALVFGGDERITSERGFSISASVDELSDSLKHSFIESVSENSPWASMPGRKAKIAKELYDIHHSMAQLSATAEGPVSELVYPTGATSNETTQSNTLATDNAALLKQQLDAARALYLTSQAQAGVLSGMGGGPGGWTTFLGSFATGITDVPMEGLAYLHKGEAVLPASVNPFTNNTGQSIQVILHGDAQRFRDDVEVLVDGKKAEIIDEVNNSLGFRVGMARGNPGSPGRVARY